MVATWYYMQFCLRQGCIYLVRQIHLHEAVPFAQQHASRPMISGNRLERIELAGRDEILLRQAGAPDFHDFRNILRIKCDGSHASCLGIRFHIHSRSQQESPANADDNFTMSPEYSSPWTRPPDNADATSSDTRPPSE